MICLHFDAVDDVWFSYLPDDPKKPFGDVEKKANGDPCPHGGFKLYHPHYDRDTRTFTGQVGTDCDEIDMESKEEAWRFVFSEDFSTVIEAQVDDPTEGSTIERGSKFFRRIDP